MTDEFLRSAMRLMDEEESLTGTRIIRNKFTGDLAGYGLLTFTSQATALMVMHKLNSKIIPNSQPVGTFFYYPFG